MISKAIFLFKEQKCLCLCMWEVDIAFKVVPQNMKNRLSSAIPPSFFFFPNVSSGITHNPTTNQTTTRNDQLPRNVVMLCQIFILPGSEIFQHNLAQNFDPVVPLLLVFFHSM